MIFLCGHSPGSEPLPTRTVLDAVQEASLTAPPQLCNSLLHKFLFRSCLRKCPHIFRFARAKAFDTRKLRSQILAKPIDDLRARSFGLLPVQEPIRIHLLVVESAGIVLVRSDPRDVVRAIELSRAAYRKMVQNLVWATAYNVIAIPVAAGIFIRWGLDLPMSVGAMVMSLSTIIVALNAQLLRRLKLSH